ncbi:hypothetical protein [Streptomyces sp. NPDC056468]|uniref:hypothetical protein n=1 Tax=Streptomyces sp. NPDC056468 TaxID=3345830 RepID=UPI0036A2D2ED
MGASPGDSKIPAELHRTAEAIASARNHGREQGILVVNLEQPLVLSKGDVQQGMERLVEAKNSHNVHLVVVQKGADSGPGGTVLLLLADRRVVVPEDATISTLPKEVLASAHGTGLCSRRDRLCQLLSRPEAQPIHVTKDALRNTDPRMAAEPRQLTLPSGEDEEGAGIGPYGVLLITLLAAGTALLLLTVLRTRYRTVLAAEGARTLTPATGTSSWPTRPAGPATVAPRSPPRRSRPAEHERPRPTGPRAVPDGPVRPATVRTGLHPQGYVELDGWLYRASWAEPYLDAPEPGAIVDVTDRRPGLLLAYAPGDSRGSRA